MSAAFLKLQNLFVLPPSWASTQVSRVDVRMFFCFVNASTHCSMSGAHSDCDLNGLDAALDI